MRAAGGERDQRGSGTEQRLGRARLRTLQDWKPPWVPSRGVGHSPRRGGSDARGGRSYTAETFRPISRGTAARQAALGGDDGKPRRPCSREEPSQNRSEGDRRRERPPRTPRRPLHSEREARPRREDGEPGARPGPAGGHGGRVHGAGSREGHTYAHASRTATAREPVLPRAVPKLPTQTDKRVDAAGGRPWAPGGL